MYIYSFPQFYINFLCMCISGTQVKKIQAMSSKFFGYNDAFVIFRRYLIQGQPKPTLYLISHMPLLQRTRSHTPHISNPEIKQYIIHTKKQIPDISIQLTLNCPCQPMKSFIPNLFLFWEVDGLPLRSRSSSSGGPSLLNSFQMQTMATVFQGLSCVAVSQFLSQ